MNLWTNSRAAMFQTLEKAELLYSILVKLEMSVFSFDKLFIIFTEFDKNQHERGLFTDFCLVAQYFCTFIFIMIFF